MELVTILRELWRRRTIVALVALVSLLVGAAVAFRLPSLESRKYEVGIATARILVDTPKSQVVEVAPQGSDTLGIRANLIASLMADGVVKDAIAKRAGLKVSELEGVAETTAGTGQPAETKSFSADDHVLTTRVIQTPEGDRLPIIDLETQAPTTAAAAKLADAAVAGLRDYLESRAASEQVKAAKRLRFTSLGPARAGEFVRGPGVAMAIGAALFVFIVGCSIMLAFLALARGWREVEEEEFLTEVFQEDDLFDSPSPSASPSTTDEESNVSQMWTDWSEPAMPSEARRNKV